MVQSSEAARVDDGRNGTVATRPPESGHHARDDSDKSRFHAGDSCLVVVSRRQSLFCRCLFDSLAGQSADCMAADCSAPAATWARPGLQDRPADALTPRPEDLALL